MRVLVKMIAAASCAALVAGSAQAACWSDAAYRAAQVRELDTMLMVEALRCRKTPASFLDDYNRFVEASRPALLKANTALKEHFAGEGGERAALDAYDNYMTMVANRYGAGAEGLGCDDMGSIARAVLAGNGSPETLYQIAVAAQMVPTIREARCEAGGAPVTMTMLTAR